MCTWSLCALRLRDYVESIIIVYVEFLLEINMYMWILCRRKYVYVESVVEKIHACGMRCSGDRRGIISRKNGLGPNVMDPTI